MHDVFRSARAIAAVVALFALASCGGDDGPQPFNQGVMAQTCSPNNPYGTNALGDITTEKTWLRNYIDRSYLWYDKVPAVNPADPVYSNDTPLGFYDSIDTYFLDLTRPLTNPPGKPVDRFSFTYPTAAWDQLINSGSTVGYGIEWHIVQADNTTTPPTPREIRAAFVHTGSTADIRGILRGDTLVLADGVSAQDTTSAGVAVLNSVLVPVDGSTHTLRFSRGGVTGTADYTLTAGPVTLTPVKPQVLTIGAQKVGYLLFSDHVLTAEEPLINAFAAFQTAGVSDLVLDLRYNGGGYLYIASEVAYMIAGAARTANQVFETMEFSNKRSNENASGGFSNLACVPDANFQCTRNDPLPTLNLPRVYVLVSDSTCSASEAIINGLRGVDIDVRLIGGTTCGKPYGFYGQDNCGISYFAIEFQGVNAKGFGGYANGFIPGGTGTTDDNLPGCAANDDLDHALGDPAEGQLASALSYRNSGNTACLPLMVGNRVSPLAAGQSAAVSRGQVIKPLALTNRNGRMPAR